MPLSTFTRRTFIRDPSFFTLAMTSDGTGQAAPTEGAASTPSALEAGTASADQAPGSDRQSFFEMIHVLASFRQNHERLKLFRVSLSVIRFLSILNFVYTVLGVTFLVLALCTDWTPEFSGYQRTQFFRIGEAKSVSYMKQ